MAKIISCLCFCGLSIAMSGQSALQTYTSTDRAFQFKYSPLVIRCTPQEGQPGYWVPNGRPDSNGCVCDDHQDSATIVCFTYPGRSEHFLGAFFVAEVPLKGECMEHWPNATCKPLRMKRKDCLAGSSNWWPPETPRSITRGQSTKINSIRAKLFRVSGGGLSHFDSSNIYRIFHGKKCYELVIQETGVTSTAFDPEEFEEIEKVAKEDDKNTASFCFRRSSRFVSLPPVAPEGCINQRIVGEISDITL